MAISVGLKLQSEFGSARTYCFFKSNGSSYGTLTVDLDSHDVRLLNAEDRNGEEFAFLRARRAVEKALSHGELPEELSLSA